MEYTKSDMVRSLVLGICIVCRRRVTLWDRIKRIVWAPITCRTSIFWEICCSKGCYREFLESEYEKINVKNKENC